MEVNTCVTSPGASPQVLLGGAEQTEKEVRINCIHLHIQTLTIETELRSALRAKELAPLLTFTPFGGRNDLTVHR